MNKYIRTIRKEFRRSEEARYIHRLHGVLLVLLGLSTVKAGKLLGDPQRTIAHWVVQFKLRGLDGLKDQEKSGRRGSLDSEQRKLLATLFAKSPKEAGLAADEWTGPLLASVLIKRFRIDLSPRQCARILKTLIPPTET